MAAFVTAIAAGRAFATPFAYVGSTAGGTPSVKVIDTATDTVVATIPVDVAVGGVAVSPAGSRVYVTPYSIKVIDTSTNTVTATRGDRFRGRWVGTAARVTGASAP